MKTLLALLFFAPALFAQGFLYEIQKDQEAPSYLFGTIHVAQEHLFDLNPKLPQIINKVDSVYFEIISNDNDLQKMMLPYVFGDSLSTVDLLPKEKLEAVKSFAVKHIGSEQILLMRPIFPLLLFLQSLYVKDEVMPMDFHFMKIAKSQNKGLGQLESMEQQFALLNAIPVQQQIDEIINVVENTEDYQKSMHEMIAIYEEQNLNKLTHYLNSASASGDVFASPEIFQDRNLSMAQKIQKLSPHGANLYFIGAGHLGGKQGVLALLKAKGYQVKAIQ